MIKQLLIIEDEHITANLLRLTVAKHQFAETVFTLSNGHQAVEYFEQLVSGEETGLVPDLIFLDINMPIMNGWDFLDEFSVRFEPEFPETKICMLTSSVDPRDKQQAFYYSSVIAFISKPLRSEEIVMLRNHKSLKHFFQ